MPTQTANVNGKCLTPAQMIFLCIISEKRICAEAQGILLKPVIRATWLMLNWLEISSFQKTDSEEHKQKRAAQRDFSR